MKRSLCTLKLGPFYNTLINRVKGQSSHRTRSIGQSHKDKGHQGQRAKCQGQMSKFKRSKVTKVKVHKGQG